MPSILLFELFSLFFGSIECLKREREKKELIWQSLDYVLKEKNLYEIRFFHSQFAWRQWILAPRCYIWNDVLQITLSLSSSLDSYTMKKRIYTKVHALISVIWHWDWVGGRARKRERPNETKEIIKWERENPTDRHRDES